MRPWKILANKKLTGFRLYNIEQDPREQNELSRERPKRLKRMKKRIREHVAAIERERSD